MERKNITTKKQIEENIRAQRLKEAEIAKKTLKNRLAMLDSQIQELKVSSDENSMTPIKKNILLSKEEFKERENKAYEFVQKLNKQRKEKEKRDIKRRKQLDKDMKLGIDAYSQSRVEYEERLKNDKKNQILERFEYQEK